MKLRIATVFAASLSIMPAAKALDQNLPAYQTVPGISGQIKSVGSDTLHEAMELWVKGFNQLYPDVKIVVEGKGSATAPPALLEGASQLGPMSRSMNLDQSTAFQKKYGYKVSDFAVALDALAVYVNKDNPIKCLTLEQVDGIFSARRLGSGGHRIQTWGDAGLEANGRRSQSTCTAVTKSPGLTGCSGSKSCRTES